MIKIPADINSMDRLGRVNLSSDIAIQSIKSAGNSAFVGATVILWAENDYEVKAVLDYDQKHGFWVASPIWSTLRDFT